MGMGSMKVDLRELDLPAGRTDLPLEIGMGEIKVLVPDDLCVTTEADVGMGAVNTGDGEQGGVDLEVDDDAPGVARRPAPARDRRRRRRRAAGRRPASTAGTGPAAGTTTASTTLETGTSRAACQGAA